MGLKFGITHAEYRYNKRDDKVYLIEIAARGGGDRISSDLTKLASGFNTNEALIDYVVEGNVHKVNFDKLYDKVALWQGIAFSNDGIICNIKGLEDIKNIDGVYKVEIKDIQIGKKVSKFIDDTGKYGLIFISANTEKECYKILNKVKDTLRIEINTNEGIKTQVW